MNGFNTVRPACRMRAVPTKRRSTRAKPCPLSVELILKWADEHHARKGSWPNINSGVIHGSEADTWDKIYQALYQGLRGLPGGSSLARLLAEHRGMRNRVDCPLTKKQILEWADAHRRRKGKWPTNTSGPVIGCPGETWENINANLHRGDRGLPGGESLAQLLHARRGARTKNQKQRLSIAQVLTWADAHYRRFRDWPDTTSGRVVGTLDEEWANIDACLNQGFRGLPSGSSLAILLAEHRGIRRRRQRPRLSESLILAWADAHHERTGQWPNDRSGEIVGSDDEYWNAVEAALRMGRRGLPGGSSLALFLEKHGRRPRGRRVPRLTVQQILQWADAHHERTGRWPTNSLGELPDAPDERWQRIEQSLRLGLRGLRGGTTLARLLAQHRGVRNQGNLPPLTVRQILTWAEAYFRRNGAWPTRNSGEIPEAPSETWLLIDHALQKGRRGLPRKLSVKRILAGVHATPSR